jgi:hypothetical protein
MKQQEVFKKIGLIIKELNEQYDYLVSTENELNDLELELFVANAHFLADHSEVLRKLNLQKSSTPIIPPPIPEERYFEPVVQHPTAPIETPQVNNEILPQPISVKPDDEILLPPPVAPAKPDAAVVTNATIEESHTPHIDLRGDDTGTDYSYIRQEPEVIHHELNLDETSGWGHEDVEPANIELSHPEEEVVISPPIELVKNEPLQPIVEKPRFEPKVADIQEEPLTINQRIMAQLNNTANRATEHLHAPPVADLKQAINLNDKLLYIKDLFNGYNLAYSEAIDILNRYSAFDEADKFLKSNYAAKNNWESKQATVDKFYELLKRRYA